MRIGTIKFFNAAKGFGFVTPDGGGADIFLPAAALAASGLQTVKQGARVSFEQAPDPRGLKVVTLKPLEEALPKPPQPAPDWVNVYCDPASDAAADILGAVRAAGYQLQLHDYVGTPLPLDQLQRLSHMLGQAGQSLVRRYDPLFLALQLDDRFITDQDFWTGIAEHPALINGPVLLHAGKARICKSAEDVRAFLGNAAPAVPLSKFLSPRIAAMLKGEAVPAPAPPPPASKVAAPPPPQPKSPIKPIVAKPAKPMAPPPKPKAVAKPAKPDKKKPAPGKAAQPAKKPKKKTRK